MGTTQRFRELRSELRRLREHFLPKDWHPAGVYSERQLDRARAYRILAHAEIEYYLENVLLDVVNKEYKSWKSSKRLGNVMFCLVLCSKLGWEDNETQRLDMGNIVPFTIRAPKEKDKELTTYFLDQSVEQYRKIVKKNNGLKEVDIKRLIMPIGLALADLDQTWLNDMNSFGGKRGDLAHTSRRGIKNVPDPKSEKYTVDRLLKGLKEFDAIIAKM